MKVFGENANKKVIEESSFTNIDIVTNNADVMIVPTESLEPTVEYTGSNKKTKFIFDAAVKGDTLSVQLKQKRKFFFSFGFNSGDIKLTVSVPEKQYKNLQVMSDNGRINVENLHAEGILLETDNGQIHVRNVEAKTVNVETDNGKVILEDVKGKIMGSTDNGQISLITNDIDSSVDLSTDNGSIEVKTESKPSNASIEAKSGNGKITIFGQETKLKVYGKGTHLMKLQTDNGSITVE
jgi:DUF4097 and DUF4098 domain-containing protein YvlB